jgi:Cu2+-exporting ATPase
VHGRTVLVGNRTLLERGGATPSLDSEAEKLRAEAKTVLYVAADGRMLGLIAVADPIRPTASRAVRALHGLGVRVLLLTGDSRATAEVVARTVGIDEVRAEVLPGDKAAEVRHLHRDVDARETGGLDECFGDVHDGRDHFGVDDRAAEVRRSRQPESSSRDDPADVPFALGLAREVRRKIKQNLFWAAIYNVVAIPLAGGALYPSLGILLKPAWAALAMSTSTVTVTLNALLLPSPRSV